jgi:DNA-binding Lrp family transcriptional regulator
MSPVVGASEQTMARRYRRMAEAGAVRVVGHVMGGRGRQSDWVLRIRSAPDTTMRLALALAARSDTSWVQLTSAGTEIVCLLLAHDEDQRQALLLEQLPSGGRITHLQAYRLLNPFGTGERKMPWGQGALDPAEVAALVGLGPGGNPGCRGGPGSGEGPALGEATAGQQVAVGARPAAGLGPAAGERVVAGAGPEAGERVVAGAGPEAGERVALRPEDRPLLRALAENGRATWRQLAQRTKWHETTVRRRVEELVASGVIYFDLDLQAELLGIGTRAMLWVSVAPADLDVVGRAIARHDEVAFVAATSGPTNLMAVVLCRDDRALYDYLSLRLARLRGVTHIETEPIIRTIKRHASLDASLS